MFTINCLLIRIRLCNRREINCLSCYELVFPVTYTIYVKIYHLFLLVSHFDLLVYKKCHFWSYVCFVFSILSFKVCKMVKMWRKCWSMLEIVSKIIVKSIFPSSLMKKCHWFLIYNAFTITKEQILKKNLLFFQVKSVIFYA